MSVTSDIIVDLLSGSCKDILRASPHLHNSTEFIHMTEGILELGMARDLGVSKFTLFRVFSGNDTEWTPRKYRTLYKEKYLREEPT